MNELAATDGEFEALLDASSLSAPHVMAETSAIPASARRRMARAIQQQSALDRPARASRTSGPQRIDGQAAATPPAAPGTDRHTPLQGASAAAVSFCPGSFRRLLFLPTGAGKSRIAILTAVQYWATDSNGGRDRQPPRPWAEHPAANRQRASLWLRPGLGETPPFSKPAGSVASYGRRQAPWLRLLTGERLMSFYERLLASNGWTGQDQGPLHLPQRTPTMCQLHTPDWTGPEQNLRFQDLRRFIQPSLAPASAVIHTEFTGLRSCAMRPPALHIVCFGESAYTAAASGLMLPDTAAEQRHLHGPRLHLPQMAGSTAQDAMKRMWEGRTRLWTTKENGLRVLHTKLTMLFHLDEREALAQSVHTRLTYRASDPYAVEARFRADSEDETVWTFARDLLRDGLERTAGLGDVLVWPDANPQGPPRVYLRLTSPDGTATLSAADLDVRAFLEAATKLVSYGCEHTFLQPALRDLESTIGELARPGSD
ncbi:SsgA family sporulation/cell division regulator [Streptomyces sp. BF23-18]|uniref:SsgA family sporulation/cell division regulator n=1 Tax=Streptomyces sp. BF23-18 TaxID=3240282 RepID=UPI0034E3DC58